jgi:DNA modification methylase
LLVGDAATRLRELPDGSAQTCVTSPPYWGLRDYGVEGQIGLEQTPDAYVAALVAVFRELRRVLREDGTLWVNLGDSYVGSANSGARGKQDTIYRGVGLPIKSGAGLKSKDLVGIPWLVAFALRADGWYLRQDLIWAKPNPMPESVRDRCTKAHEYLFLLSKSDRYCFDANAIREPMAHPQLALKARNATNPNAGRIRDYQKDSGRNDGGTHISGAGFRSDPDAGRNRRSVWTVASQPFKGAHFATFPPRLIEPCILAGSRPWDVVLDPFAGAGTTGLVALQHGRSFVGIELNPEYASMAWARMNAR